MLQPDWRGQRVQPSRGQIHSIRSLRDAGATHPILVTHTLTHTFTCLCAFWQEWLRLDRYYCQSRLFRDLLLEDGTVGEAECRENITQRVFMCKEEVCEKCTSQCTYPTAKAVASVAKCTFARGQLGFTNCLQTTDAGQLARASHGAIRAENYIAVSPRRCQTTLHLFCFVCSHSDPPVDAGRFPNDSRLTRTRSAISTPRDTCRETVRIDTPTIALPHIHSYDLRACSYLLSSRAQRVSDGKICSWLRHQVRQPDL